MASLFTLSLLLLSLSLLTTATASPSSPYLSPIFPKNYDSMSTSFKIFTYIPLKPISFSSPAESLFYKSLLDSPYSTHNPHDAHLFFVPFSPHLSTRSLARLIRTLRTELPYWNRTLGADHFFLSSAGLGYASDRNVVELKKNAIQVSGCPVPPGKFIPHKDITLPPVFGSLGFSSSRIPAPATERVLGFVGYGWVRDRALVKELIEDPEFLMETEPPPPSSEAWNYGEKMAKSDFCLFEYGGVDGGVLRIGEALRHGCVPVVISDRPMQDLPLMDVLRWQDMAVFVNGGGGMEGVKRKLRRVDEESLVKMKRLGEAAAQHFVWNSPPRPLDAFNTVAYQLWVRRHAVRYAERKEWAQS